MIWKCYILKATGQVATVKVFACGPQISLSVPQMVPYPLMHPERPPARLLHLRCGSPNYFFPIDGQLSPLSAFPPPTPLFHNRPDPSSLSNQLFLRNPPSRQRTLLVARRRFTLALLIPSSPPHLLPVQQDQSTLSRCTSPM